MAEADLLPWKKWLTTGLTTAVLVSGCTDVRDSRATAPVERWALPELPVVSIGSLDGALPSVLSRAYRGRILSDSSVLVVEGSELRIFDHQGSWLRTVGREGSGPGDLRSPSWMVETGEGLRVWDAELSRLTTFAPEGEVETTPLSSRAIPGFPRLVGILPGEQLVFLGTERFPEEIPRGSPQRYSVGQMVNTLVVESATSADTVLRGDGPRRYFVRVNRDDAGLGLGFEPLSSNHHVHAGSDFVAIGHGRWRHLRVVNAERTLDSIPLGFRRDPVDGEVRRQVRQFEVEEASGRARDVSEIVLDHMEWPDSMPYIDDLFVDSSDRIWVRHFTLRSAARQWSIYTRSRGRVAAVSVPTSFSVLDARDSWLLTRRTDDLGVPFVDLWEMGRAGGER